VRAIFFGWGGEALCIKSAPSAIMAAAALLAAFFALLSYPSAGSSH
jgi:hypothetical protein